MAIREVQQTIKSGSYRSPKTILGFFAIIIGILLTATTATIGILSRSELLHWLIVPVLIFAALVILFVLIGVFVTAWKDATVLMLGQVTGQEFIENRKLTLGDSISGEYIEDFSPALELEQRDTKRLPEPKTDEEAPQ